MKKLMNFTTSWEDERRFADTADLRGFYRAHGLDGVELSQVGQGEARLTEPRDVVGVHLRYFTGWLDLWHGNERRLLAEYDDWQTCRQVFGGADRQALTEAFRENLRFAAKQKPEYLVFHVSECTIEESMRRNFYYSDEEVIDASVELINGLLPELAAFDGRPWLLFENLWYSGLTMLRPEMTRRLLEGVRYPRVGVMLDVGHLLHTNMELTSLEQGVEYICRALGRYDDLSFIRGVHLHQTLSGAYAAERRRSWQPEQGDYWQRVNAILPHIYRIDSHRPFVSAALPRLFELLRPDYLVLEQISESREVHGEQLARQLASLGFLG